MGRTKEVMKFAKGHLSCECLVVGAGAAGCAFGYLLRRAGRDVLALELGDAGKKDKLCGGVLGIGALELLAKTYGDDALTQLAPFSPPHLIRRSRNRELVSDIRFCAMPRSRLDTWLLARYIEEGGRLHDRVRVNSIDPSAHLVSATDLRTGDTLRITYGVLVGADGASSGVRRILTGRRQRIVVSLEGPVQPVGQDIVFSYELGSVGYCWYIPTGGEANAGCCMYGVGVRECRTWLLGFCDEMGLALTTLRGAPIPTGDDVLLAPANAVWLVGDAAGLITPGNSGGIHYALGSAHLLASSLCGGMPYEQAMRPLVKVVEHSARHVASKYFARSLEILYRGTDIA